jgi:hypothetical protein
VKANEVRVNHPRENPKLLLELVNGRGVDVQNRLKRDTLPLLAIAGLVDGPHAAAPDAANDLKPLGPLPVKGIAGDRPGRRLGALRRTIQLVCHSFNITSQLQRSR